MATFRIATLNVHSFSNPNTGESNVRRLIETLKPYCLDLVAVQEIQEDDDWINFSTDLGLDHHLYGSSDGLYLGNGIVSRYPISSHLNTVSEDSYSGGRRSLLKFSLEGDHSFLRDRTFAVTHLDHLNEDNRLKQIEGFNPLEENIDILLGDMNSLTRDDYTCDYYENKILNVRKKSYWETPRFDLTELITKQWSYQDAFKVMNPTLKDEQLSTCRFGTRIDYIYLRPRMRDSWVLKECSIIHTHNATDHNAVFAVFKQE